MTLQLAATPQFLEAKLLKSQSVVLLMRDHSGVYVLQAYLEAWHSFSGRPSGQQPSEMSALTIWLRCR